MINCLYMIATHIFYSLILPQTDYIKNIPRNMGFTVFNMIIHVVQEDFGSKGPINYLKTDSEVTLAFKGQPRQTVSVFCRIINFPRWLLCILILCTLIVVLNG